MIPAALRSSGILPLAGVAAVGVGILLITDTSVWWQCPIHATTGLLCPGCGGQRAAVALVRGDIAGAIRLNATLFVAPPLMVLGEWSQRHGPRWLVWATIAAAVAFVVGYTVWRNLAL
ncbi:uncharacterized protein DUF2752 [Microbacteriaceae bacterium MWH-Ta3]|nr:uncharacterized protein DUF2752 [Microbacteriaceae bacterium MWH-Ta3]